MKNIYNFILTFVLSIGTSINLFTQPLPPGIKGVAPIGGAVPTVMTTSATEITSASATLGGNVTADGGSAVTESGIVYSLTDESPTIAENATKVAISSGTGTFSEAINSLSENTTYYYNAYAINSIGVSYGTASNVCD
ncbi:MAG: hypothetical protein PHH37_15090 [Paludibacter sp.]|nr:hypothetical protein [Paludibacter sp.]